MLMASPAAVKQCLEQEPRVYLTHVNAPQEVVIAGDPQGCLRVIERLQCDAFRSPSDMVLHCEAMQSEFAAFMQRTLSIWEHHRTQYFTPLLIINQFL